VTTPARELRCAAYARYSTDRQNPVSIDDQVRKCREFADSNSWQFLDRHTYSDEAISGATDDRPGLKRLLEAAISPGHPFDVVLIDDTSRLSRKLADSIRISDRLRFANVRLVFVSQGIDTDSEQADVLLATHGIVDSLYIRELAKKVYRGVEGRALKGLHPGGRCFGYRSQPIEDPTRTDAYGRPIIVGVKLAVDESEAEAVRRVFSLYAAGYSFESAARMLVAEGTPSPRPKSGKHSQPWGASTVQKILHNDRYRGVVIWSKTRKLRSPETGRRIYRRRPPTEWIMVEAPAQRIVTDELWDRVHRRIDQVKQLYGNAGRRAGLLRAHTVNSRFLFSGFLKCGLCGVNMTIVSGRGRENPYARYGCPRNALQRLCPNSLRVRRDVLEQALLGRLQAEVLRPEVVDYTLERFERQLITALDNVTGKLEQIRQRKAKLEEEIRRLTRAIADGHYSPSIMADITAREREIAEIANRLLESQSGSVQAQLKNIRLFVVTRLTNLPNLLNADALTARSEMAKHVQTITLHPDGETYKVSGTWDLLGDARMVASSEREARMDVPHAPA
jgi:site-specific DNA recombinase